jgi:S-adenosyl-L-methionine hydrolase (adenosine-forming)
LKSICCFVNTLEDAVRIVTLMTDFGLKDGNVAVMKGVIWQIAPVAQIVDLSHLIQPQNIKEAALILSRAVPFFPPQTIHVAVVDPGVGTSRRAIAAKIGSQYFVGPDNGVFSLILDSAEKNGRQIECMYLDNNKYWASEVSNVFHGRDIFAPVAGHLANGLALQSIGSPISDMVRFQFSSPEKTATGWNGEIIFIDHFGNIATNILENHISDRTNITTRLCGIEIKGMVRTFGMRSPSDIIAFINSSGTFSIGMVNGNAAEKIGADVGDRVEVAL